MLSSNYLSELHLYEHQQGPKPYYLSENRKRLFIVLDDSSISLQEASIQNDITTLIGEQPQVQIGIDNNHTVIALSVIGSALSEDIANHIIHSLQS